MLTDRKTREVVGVTVFAGADWPMEEPLVISVKLVLITVVTMLL